MRRLRLFSASAPLTGLVLLALIGPAPSIAAVSYKATLSGKQELDWKVDGVTTGCESRHGAGGGHMEFHFRNSGPVLAVVVPRGRGMSIPLSIPSVATGSIAGTFADSLAKQCEAQPPRESSTWPTTGCGTTKFGVRADFLYREDGFIYVTGPQLPYTSVPGAKPPGNCPFPFEQSFEHASGSPFPCGDASQQWKRSWGVATTQGQGLFASRLAVKPRALLRPKHKTLTLTGSATVACNVPSEYSGGVQITGKLTYALTLKRAR
jgi:hypothetical protein